MPVGLYANLKQVKNETSYLSVEIVWNSPAIYDSDLIMGRLL